MQVIIIANSEPKGYLITSIVATMKPASLKSYLMKVRQNLIGNVGLALTLKRQRRSTNQHVIGVALKFMQVVDITPISEPPLNTPTEFMIDRSAHGSERLMHVRTATSGPRLIRPVDQCRSAFGMDHVLIGRTGSYGQSDSTGTND